MPLETTSPEASGTNNYIFTVNGVRFSTNDRLENGREILQRAGFEPPSEHVLIQITHPGSKSIGLDEAVDFKERGKEEFRAFSSDRIFNFTLNERGYEWGSPTISEAELRDISGTPEEMTFVLDREDRPDEHLEEGANVDLSKRGTEHLRTVKRVYHIIVNARPVDVTTKVLTYAQVIPLGYEEVPTGPDIVFTVAYRKGPPENPKGTLAEGESVVIKNGMVFVVEHTNRS